MTLLESLWCFPDFFFFCFGTFPFNCIVPHLDQSEHFLVLSASFLKIPSAVLWFLVSSKMEFHVILSVSVDSYSNDMSKFYEQLALKNTHMAGCGFFKQFDVLPSDSNIDCCRKMFSFFCFDLSRSEDFANISGNRLFAEIEPQMVHLFTHVLSFSLSLPHVGAIATK